MKRNRKSTEREEDESIAHKGNAVESIPSAGQSPGLGHGVLET